MNDLFDRYLDAFDLYRFEGESGVRNLEKIVSDVGGYRDIYQFLADNSGAVNGIVEFIAEWTERNSDWQANLESLVGPGKEDDMEESVDQPDELDRIMRNAGRRQ